MLTIFLLLIIFFGSLSAGFYLPEIFYNEIKSVKDTYNLKRLKPFDCEVCLTFWICALSSFTVTNITVAILNGMIAFAVQVYIVDKYKL